MQGNSDAPKTKLPKPLGLALSGGGFRAAAFHLGVLKRLNELALLGKIDFVSTVSGGSIAGAAWIYWQAQKGDTIGNPNEWDRFEASLISLMRSGLRERLISRGLFTPFIASAISMSVAMYFVRPKFYSNEVGISEICLLVAVTFGLAYVSWHYTATRFLIRAFDRWLFRKTTLGDLYRDDLSRDTKRFWPHLIINATGLNSGDHLLFSPPSRPGSSIWRFLLRTLPNRTGIPASPGTWRLEPEYRETPPRVRMASNTSLAKGVAASCALPSLFAPLALHDPEPWWEWPAWWKGKFRAVDGGVSDNQGIQILLDGNCHGIIVSDAAGVLRTQPKPATWQLFPPGNGVIFRSQNIIYERMRELGFRILEERAEFYRILNEIGGLDLASERRAPTLEGYVFLELWPSDRFKWKDRYRLPSIFYSPVARIRTDLDGFSPIEISILMFHGYTIVDHCIRSYHNEWIAASVPPLRFRSCIQDVNIVWSELSPAETGTKMCHLVASDSRSKSWRALQRCWFLWRSRKVRRQLHLAQQTGTSPVPPEANLPPPPTGG
jgi:NTE family protein